MGYSLNKLYHAIGITKQAVSQYQRRHNTMDHRLLGLIDAAMALRKAHPGCGVEKMYTLLKPSFIGRDRFIELMMTAGFRLKRPPNYRRTTYAGRVNYSNKIKGMTVRSPSVIWQSDITYLPVGDRVYYAVFIIDVYSKKIVGYTLSKTMHATANIQAFQQALKEHRAPVIHHSDRGGQYGSLGYTKLLKSHGVQISMATTAQDNAYAERINRTIKEEYLAYWNPKTFEQLAKCLKRAVANYNELRPHNHLDKRSPVTFEKEWNKKITPTKALTIFDENNIKKPVNRI
ncbi:MAG: IS3 family transposase [Chitinophagaceae bacterium]|nr:IS3 family transposase [Chitinophagaceae bacterium]